MKWVDAALAWAALLYSSAESFTRSMTLVIALVFAVLLLRYVQGKRSKRFLDGQPPLIITSKGPRQLRAKLMPTVNGVLGLPEADYMEPGNKSSPRGSSHGLDSLIHRQSRSKRISNWMGYKALGQRWQASNNIGRAVSVAHQGLGYSTQWAWDSGPQQLYVASQPSQAPQGGMVKASVAHRPDLWVSSAVVNAVNGVTPTRTNTSVTHVNLMPEGGTKHVDIGPEKYVEKYSYAGMPTEYPRVGYAVPDGCTIERTANGRALRFLDSDGVQYMHTQDAYGWWGTEEVSLIMPNTGGVELVPQGTQLILGKTYHVFDLVPVAAEWSDSFGEVHIDPSVTVSGATDINDAHMSQKFPLNYYGTNSLVNFSNKATTSAQGVVCKINDGALPAGNVTLWDWDFYLWSGKPNMQAQIYQCLRDWVELEVRGSEYSAGNAWEILGQYSPMTTNPGITTDFDNILMTTGTLPTAPTGVRYVESLNGAIPMLQSWIDGGAPNFGWLFTSAKGGITDNSFSWVSSEWAVNAVAFYFEYTEPAAGNPHYYSPFSGNNFGNIASEGFQMGEPFSKTIERAQRFFAPRLRAA